jgi:hypothetical protein
MKPFLMLLATLLLCTSIRASGENLEEARSHYAELLNQATNGTHCMTHSVDDAFVQEIESGILYKDPSINTSIVWTVYMHSSRFFYGLPFKIDPAEIERFKSIKGLKELLADQLATIPANERAIMPAAILYGTDPGISDRLLELYESDDPLPTYTLIALRAAHLTDTEFEPVILDAISKNDALLAKLAARCLIDNPIPEALPALVKQYQRLDSELHLKFPEHIKPPSKRVDPYDTWRFTLGRAIAKYDRDTLLEFKDELMSMEERVTFGRMSRRQYTRIQMKLADSREEAMKIKLSNQKMEPTR